MTAERAGGVQVGPGLGNVLREWGRLGCTGFGGPPTHVRLLRQLCVERWRWIDATEFEDAVATCNLLPGPASTQLAIFCAWRVRGRLGALLGGLAFIVPGLVLILALAALFLAGAPPRWVLGAGAGAGAAVPAVAVRAGWSLVRASWGRHPRRARWMVYLLAGAAAAVALGPWLVLVLLGCGLVEIALGPGRDAGRSLWRRAGGFGPSGGARPEDGPHHVAALVPALAAARMAVGGVAGGVLLSLCWVAFKVGALSYGGGFVIIPLMQADAVDHHRWMSGPQFLNAVALSQITPGPVVHTVAAVGYAVAGVPGGLLAAAVAFGPSFGFILVGARRFTRLRADVRVRAFLDGAGPAAIGAILGSALTLGRALSVPWQFAVLAAAGLLLLPLRRGVVTTLLAAAAVGVGVVLAGGPLPR